MKWTSVAVVKPDHIGDLVLASPAIQFVTAMSEGFELFLPPGTIPLARYIFPEVNIVELQFPHLAKADGRSRKTIGEVVTPLTEKELVIFLREDEYINRNRISHMFRRSIYSEGINTKHESVNHKFALRKYFGGYSRDDYWSGNKNAFPVAPRVVGLSVGSGFPTNKWSIVNWQKLGRLLQNGGASVKLIGGAGERKELEILRRSLDLAEDAVIEGGADIAGFLSRVRELDVVIASDGGTGHLCSLVVPILTVAASVPFRRFAPFGVTNRLLSLDLPCSPCINSDAVHANVCFSHECSYGILPEHVLEALHVDPAPPGTRVELSGGVQLWHGVSHIDQ